MGMEPDEFYEINKSFDQFIKELQKQPVPENKIIELSARFHQTIQQQSKPLINSENKSGIQEKIIAENLKKLKGEHRFFEKSNLQNKAENWAKGLALASVGILFITIGFNLIVSPASAEFEVATLFYFNEYDGFTVLDMFALVLIFIGIFFFIRAIVEKEKK